MLMIGSNEIGGGFVRIGFTDNGQWLKAGMPLTANKINSWANKRTLIATGRISVYPPAAVKVINHDPAERHVVSSGFGRFDVFEGRKLNDKSMPRDEAEAIAKAKN